MKHTLFLAATLCAAGLALAQGGDTLTLDAADVPAASGGLTFGSDDANAQMDAYLQSKGMQGGPNVKANGDTYVIAVGLGTILAPKDDPQYTASRVNAFDRAMLAAKAEMARNLEGIFETAMEMRAVAPDQLNLKDAQTAVAYQITQLPEDSLVGGLYRAMDKKLGEELAKQPGATPAEITDSASFRAFRQASAVAAVAGLQAYHTIEVIEGDKGTIDAKEDPERSSVDFADVVFNDSYGERLCEVYEITDGDAVVIYYIGVDDGICYRCEYFYPDYSQRFDLIHSTFVTGDMGFGVSELRQEIVEEDEYGMLIITRTDGVWDTYRVTYFVDRVYDDHLSMGYYVNGKRAGTVEGDLLIEMDMDYEVVGTEVLATPWGLLETEVQVSTLENGVKATNWMLPGYDLAVVSMYEYPEGDLYISIFVECTLFFESPDYDCPSTVAVADVGVGDSKTYSLLALTSEGGYEFRDVVVSVTSVDSDGLVLECDGQTYESTVDGYLWADTTGYAYVESRVTSTPFGDRYTDIYQKDIEGGIEQLIVGHDDGVMYFLYQETEDSMLSLMLVGGTDFY